MIEKLAEKKGCYVPQQVVIDLVNEKKSDGKGITVAEIGVGIGATSVEMIKVLNDADTYYIFDFENNVNGLATDLAGINNNNVSIIPIGNTRKSGDSYGYNLAKLMLEWRESGKKFDVVYLDGAHTFMHDGIAVCVLKEMMADGGYLILDDIDWNLKGSPTMNPDVRPSTGDNFTEEQIECCQVGMVEKCFLETDSTFEKTSLSTKRVAIYKRTCAL